MEKLFGTWKLIKHPQFKDPVTGLLCYQSNGTMYVIITGFSPDNNLSEAKVIAYSGTFTFIDNVITHQVKISNDPKKVGTDQIRFPVFIDNNLVLRDLLDDKKALHIYWERVC